MLEELSSKMVSWKQSSYGDWVSKEVVNPISSCQYFEAIMSVSVTK